MTKYKKIIVFLICVNFLGIFTAFYMRQSKLKREEKAFLNDFEKFSDDYSTDFGISKDESQKCALISYNMSKFEKISDADLEYLFSTVKKYDQKSKEKKALIAYSDGIDKLDNFPPDQRRKIAAFIIDEISDSYDEDSVIFGLNMINSSKITESLYLLDKIKLQYSNQKIKSEVKHVKDRLSKK